jgi:hypothetical protein
VPLPGPTVARGHLRLATPPAARRPAENRVILFVRALAVAVGIAWLTVVGIAAATLALLPLLWRRAPLGRRLRPARPREGRVIPFQPRRQALPR